VASSRGPAILESNMKLYGALASPYVARVVLFARLKGLALEPQMPEGGIKSAAYLARNPMGKMPSLELDGELIPESEVICELLEDLHPGSGGLEGDPLARAHARLVARVHDIYVAPSSSTLFRNMNPAQRDATAVAAATAAATAGFGYLAHFVTASPYAAGRTLSVADCTLVPSFALLRRTAIPVFGLPDPTTGDGPIARWWSTVAADPVTGPFIVEYQAAVDAFLKAMSRK